MSTTECGKIMVKCDVSTTQYDNRTIKCEEKNKETTKCDKSIVTYDVGNTQCEDDTIKCAKKINEPPNVTKIQSHVILVPHNVKMVLSNVRKKEGNL